jgi:hypothetical protein
MRDRILGHVRSNVIGYLALFVALGGVSAYAADKITSKDIKRNAVRSKHIKAQQVKSPDVKDESLTAADIDEESLPGTTFVVSDESGEVALEGSDTSLLQAEIDAQGPATVLATASLYLRGDGVDADDQPRCQIFHTPPGEGSSDISSNYRQTIPNTDGDEGTMSMSASVGIEAGDNLVDVRCDEASGGEVTVGHGRLIVWGVRG